MTVSGPKYPALATNSAVSGAVSWANASNAVSDNNSYATASVPVRTSSNDSAWLIGYTFDFSEIPSSADVSQIVVEVGGFQTVASGGSSCTDLSYLIKSAVAGQITANQSTGWTSSESVHSHTFSVTWTGADVNTSAFQVGYRGNVGQGGVISGSTSISVDYLRATITWTPTNTQYNQACDFASSPTFVTTKTVNLTHTSTPVTASLTFSQVFVTLLALVFGASTAISLAYLYAAAQILNFSLNTAASVRKGISLVRTWSASLVPKISKQQSRAFALTAHTTATLQKTFQWARSFGVSVSQLLQLAIPMQHTLTVYAESANSGYLTNRDATYSNARNTTPAQSGTTNSFTVGQMKDGLNVYQTWQTLLSFDMSALSIPGGANTTVSFMVGSNAVGDDMSDTDFTVEARIDNYGSIALADFVPGTSMSSYTLAASYTTSSGWNTNQYMTFALSGTVLKTAVDSAIGTGKVQLLVDSSRVAAGNTPTGNEYVSGAPLNNANYAPKIVITYGSGWLYTQLIEAALGSSFASLKKSAGLVRSFTVTPAPALKKTISKAVSWTATTLFSPAKAFAREVTASVNTAASQLRVAAYKRTVAAGVTTGLAFDALYGYVLSLAMSVSTGFSLLQQRVKLLQFSTTLSSAVTASALFLQAITTAVSATLKATKLLTLVALFTSSVSAVLKAAAVRPLSLAWNVTASVAWSLGQSILREFSMSGTVASSLVKTVHLPRAISLSSSVALSKHVSVIRAWVTNPTFSLTKTVNKLHQFTVTASMSLVHGLLVVVSLVFGVLVSPVLVVNYLFTLLFGVSLTAQFGKTFSRLFTFAVTPVIQLARSFELTKKFTTVTNFVFEALFGFKVELDFTTVASSVLLTGQAYFKTFSAAVVANLGLLRGIALTYAFGLTSTLTTAQTIIYGLRDYFAYVVLRRRKYEARVVDVRPYAASVHTERAYASSVFITREYAATVHDERWYMARTKK